MIKGWKTFIFALLLCIFGALETFDFTQFLDAETAGYLTMIIGGIVGVLRLITTTPIFKKDK